MAALPDTSPFEALDICHRRIVDHLHDLSKMAQQVETTGVDSALRHRAAAIEKFFSSTSRDHHLQEEKDVFPALLASGDAALADAVRTLQQDHGWIEENWLELSPMLGAMASGSDWTDTAELQHAIEVFVELCTGHIALEESLVYPESRARWAQAVAARKPQAHGKR